MIEAISYLVTGIIFGTVAGISPGPLLALVISQTLRFGKKEGMKVAIAPLIADLPIILISVFFITKIASYNKILGLITLVGAIFLIYLSYECLTAKKINPKHSNVESKSLQKGFITNMLNPHPYLFWFSVGSPIILKSYNASVLAMILFIFSFYFCLVGSKVLVAFSVDRSKNFFKGNTYFYTIKFLGILLLIFAAIYVKDSVRYLDQ